ncbi:MAG: hypothetical protein OEZ57_09140 [Nitrospirota bacterium]|nr:hypothetical protein [Nitrospirota bacterium]
MMSRRSPSHLFASIDLYQWTWMSVFTFFVLSGTAISGTPIEQDPKGFYGILWGNPLAHREDLKSIDSSSSLQVYTLKQGNPDLDGIPMESLKLYGLDDQYARALFHYQGAATHKSLLEYLEGHFGNIDQPFGSMMRGLNQQFTWRGPETEITITYHGFRERGFLSAESRVLAPKFLHIHGEHSF